MAAYVIGQLKIREKSWMEEYGPKTDALVRKHGGRYLTRASSSLESLEGDRDAVPSAIVILEFPSVRQAKDWYEDPDYTDLITLRCTGSDAEIILLGNEASLT